MVHSLVRQSRLAERVRPHFEAVASAWWLVTADALLMRRTRDANMWEVRRLTNLLLRIKRYERQRSASEKIAALHDVLGKKGVIN
jgi:hypothetical protein